MKNANAPPTAQNIPTSTPTDPQPTHEQRPLTQNIPPFTPNHPEYTSTHPCQLIKKCPPALSNQNIPAHTPTYHKKSPPTPNHSK